MANNTIRATLTTTPVAVLSTAELTHIGAFKIKVRLWASADGTQVRLAWRQGRDQFTENLWQTPVASAKWCEVDLGIVTLREALLGTQTWQGRIEAKASTAGTTVDVDYLEVIPVAAGYGKARTGLRFDSPTAFSGRDEFEQTAGNLAGKTAAVGGNWAEAGDAGNFAVNATLDVVERTSTGPDAGNGRFATLDLNLTTCGVAVDVQRAEVGLNTSANRGVVARFTDTSNLLMARLSENTDHGFVYATVEKVVAGVFTQLKMVDFSGSYPGTYRVILLVDNAGRYLLTTDPLLPGLPVQGHDSVLATGGTLASGDVGIADEMILSFNPYRRYDNFAAWVPEVDHAINSGQSLEFRANGDPCIREDTTGTYWGRPGEFNGSRFYLPVDDSRVVVKARRNDVDSLPDEAVTDGVDVTVHWRSRHVVIPRS